MEKNNTKQEYLETFSRKMIQLVGDLENYKSPFAKSVSDPGLIADKIIQTAALKSAGIAGTLSLLPGSIGWLSVPVELLYIYRIQGRLIKDISALYGKDSKLTEEIIYYCMFKTNADSIFRKVVEETTVRVVIRPASLRAVDRLLQRIGLKMEEKANKKGFFRWIPFLGVALTGSFAFIDTLNSGKTAKSVFSKEILLESRENLPKNG